MTFTFIFNTYSKHLEKTPTFNTIKNDYLDNLKVSYFLSMTKQELLKIMGDMNLTQLRQILLNMDNELFIEILKQPHNDCDEKKFSLVKHD